MVYNTISEDTLFWLVTSFYFTAKNLPNYTEYSSITSTKTLDLALSKNHGCPLSPTTCHVQPTKYYCGDQIKKNVMGRAYGTFGGVNKYQ